MEKYKLNFVEFYITNACNLGCENCNRLNNYFFAGAWKWNDYKDVYAKWSEILELDRITILGGEPFLNPTLIDYVQGINKLWPNAPIGITTNGSYINKKNYYNIFKQCNVELEISAHSRERHTLLQAEIYKYLKGSIEKTYIQKPNTEKEWVNVYNNIIRAESWPTVESFKDWNKLPDYIKKECTTLHKISPEQFVEATCEIKFVDENGSVASLRYSENFFLAPLKYLGNNKFSVYNNEPEQAHKTCISKHCHHFIAGKLYKCHYMGLLPQFLKQFHVEISSQDLELLEAYVPATTDMNKQKLDDFFNSIKSTIPQCKLCPINPNTFPIKSVNTKPRLQKITGK